MSTRNREEWKDSPLERVPYPDLTAELFILATGGGAALPALAATMRPELCGGPSRG